jgi:hypothetical protein
LGLFGGRSPPNSPNKFFLTALLLKNFVSSGWAVLSWMTLLVKDSLNARMTKRLRTITVFLPVVLTTLILHVGFTFAANQPAAVNWFSPLNEVRANEVAAPLTTTQVFSEVTAYAGISADHNQLYLVTGQAWGDYNNDGWVDLYVTDNNGPNTLFHNNGDGSFRVSDLTDIVALADKVSGGATIVDYNNDGWKDLYVLNRGPNTLFHNLGGSGFLDLTIQAAVGDPGQGETASWGDYDGDGYLDLFVTNWFYFEDETSEFNYDQLYHNNKNGTFTNVSAALTGQTPKPGFASSFVDYDNDGDLDIYVVNDKDYGNVLWRNDGPGCGLWCFSDVSEMAGADTKVWGMGLAVGDYDNDGDLDFYFSNGGPMVLLQNQTSQGSPTFVDQSSTAGVNFDAVGWGAVFFDYDNDKFLDIYLATVNQSANKANRLFHNLGDGTFADLSEGSGADDTGTTFGVAYADYNRDGLVDLAIGNWNQEYKLFRNDGSAGVGNHWITVELRGVGPVNRDAVGTRAYLTTEDGVTQMQEVKNGSSIGSGNELALHFGLGQANITDLTIVWPDGFTETFTEVLSNTFWQLTYPQAKVDLTDGHLNWAKPNTIRTFQHTLTNQGNRPDSYNIEVTSPSNWGITIPTTITLMPNESSLFSMTVTIPEIPMAIEQVYLTATSQLAPSVSRTVTNTLIVSTHNQFLPTIKE